MRDGRGDVISVDDNITVPAGTECTVKHVDDGGTMFVACDNGSSLGLVAGQDEWVFA